MNNYTANMRHGSMPSTASDVGMLGWVWLTCKHNYCAHTYQIWTTLFPYFFRIWSLHHQYIFRMFLLTLFPSFFTVPWTNCINCTNNSRCRLLELGANYNIATRFLNFHFVCCCLFLWGPMDQYNFIWTMLQLNMLCSVDKFVSSIWCRTAWWTAWWCWLC